MTRESSLVFQGLVALLQEGDVLLTAHEGHVRRGVDEGRRCIEDAVLDERRPELAALLELLVDRDRLGGIDRAVLAFRRVVQLAQGGVPRAGVVPRVRALESHIVQTLEDRDLPLGLQRREQGSQRRAHDPAADEQDVDRAFGKVAVVGVSKRRVRRLGHLSILGGVVLGRRFRVRRCPSKG
jgi:hypothetical protein